MTVARTGGQAQGVLACMDKNSGKVNWEHESAYAWSSPVCVYNPDGSGKVLYCNSTGHIYLLDGKTGDVLDCHQISEGVIEASPAVYQSYMVVGTRDCKIWGWNCSDAVPPHFIYAIGEPKFVPARKTLVTDAITNKTRRACFVSFTR